MTAQGRVSASARKSAPVRAFVSAGSNINPRANLKAACAALKERYPDLELSPVYESPAEGFNGPPFLNLVLSFRTQDTPEAIREVLAGLEARAGRVRSANKFSSRTLDLDLLLHGDTVNPSLKLPHPDIDRYAFVLRPLSDLAPNLRHPVTNTRYRNLFSTFPHAHQLTPAPPLQIPSAA